MNSDLVQPLFEGPVDIVGDVHGEIDALCSLLGHLGYDDGGRHPDGRRLVFLGDLTHRGPDSPSVVRLVRELVASDRAQCACRPRIDKINRGLAHQNRNPVKTITSGPD